MRLFIGIELSDDIKKSLSVFQTSLKNLGVKGSWKSLVNMHLTLEFLGESDPNQVQGIVESISAVTKKFSPFYLTIKGLGVFPSIKRPHTLWTTADGDVEVLHKIRDEIHNALINKNELSDRPFHPHITLASRPVIDQDIFSAEGNKKFGTMLVKHIILFESKAEGGKRIYIKIHQAELSVK